MCAQLKVINHLTLNTLPDVKLCTFNLQVANTKIRCGLDKVPTAVTKHQPCECYVY